MNQKIHIIESPSAKDIKDGRHESTALQSALNLFGLENNVYTVDSLLTFEEALIHHIGDEILSLKPKVTAHFLHFSCHGNTEGFSITNGDFINWEILATMLKTLNEKIGYVPIPNNPQSVLFVTVSSCLGLNMFKVINFVPSPPLFCTLIGPNETVQWSDGLLAFTAFYHNSILQKKGLSAVSNMNNVINKMNLFEAKMHPVYEAFFAGKPF